MANDTSRKPWSLDTAAVITTERVRIQSLRWVVTSGATGNNLEIEDANGERIWESINTVGTEFNDVDYPYADFEGFELTTIDGTSILYVTLG